SAYALKIPAYQNFTVRLKRDGVNGATEVGVEGCFEPAICPQTGQTFHRYAIKRAESPADKYSSVGLDRHRSDVIASAGTGIKACVKRSCGLRRFSRRFWQDTEQRY